MQSSPLAICIVTIWYPCAIHKASRLTKNLPPELVSFANHNQHTLLRELSTPSLLQHLLSASMTRFAHRAILVLGALSSGVLAAPTPTPPKSHSTELGQALQPSNVPIGGLPSGPAGDDVLKVRDDGGGMTSAVRGDEESRAPKLFRPGGELERLYQEELNKVSTM
ncbi:hypothetical protein FB446DRAFT_187406 [Lentinula raphanica]|nr:hypothetical protein FB446DRAFT_187406 [Lentinula raphanica]